MSTIEREKEYILFCDESDKRGKYYSNFYGGVLVGASQYQRITDRLNLLKTSLNIKGEIKWQRVTDQYLSKYMALMQAFFEEVSAGNLKVRIMFTQNAKLPTGLTKEQLEQEYFLLYYQFAKHSFGLSFLPNNDQETRIRLYFDEFPETGEKVERFRGYLLGLPLNKHFKSAGITIAKEDVAEVRSHEHVLLQCLDVTLGSISFRLNDKHKLRPEGHLKCGKRTRAKNELHEEIRRQIRLIHPNFNIGISTGVSNYPYPGRWTAPYLHWCFCAASVQSDPLQTKRQKRNDPT